MFIGKATNPTLHIHNHTSHTRPYFTPLPEFSYQYPKHRTIERLLDRLLPRPIQRQRVLRRMAKSILLIIFSANEV